MGTVLGLTRLRDESPRSFIFRTYETVPMTIDHRSASSTLQQLLATHTAAQLLAKLAPDHAPLAPRVPSGGIDRDTIAQRWAVLPDGERIRPGLLDEKGLE